MYFNLCFGHMNTLIQIFNFFKLFLLDIASVCQYMVKWYLKKKQYLKLPLIASQTIKIKKCVPVSNDFYFSENVVRKLNVPANTVVSMTFWDIPGREDMDLHKSYFRNLDAAIGNYYLSLFEIRYYHKIFSKAREIMTMTLVMLV